MKTAQLFINLKLQMNTNGGICVDLKELLNKQKSLDIGINQLCKEAFDTAKSKGWHDQPREMGTILCLIHGEVSEAMEADRRGEGWDRVTEELADVCIRIFDLCGSLNLNLEKAIKEKMEYNKSRSYKHGGKAY
jgi:NTP pyrophosphatase (non-canonical NTP hydrolase)